MFCIRCQNDVAYCTCPDIAERMAAIAQHPAWATQTCLHCEKHVDLCDCPDTGENQTAMLSAVDTKPETGNVADDPTVRRLRGANNAAVTWNQKLGGVTTVDGVDWINVGKATVTQSPHFLRRLCNAIAAWWKQ